MDAPNPTYSEDLSSKEPVSESRRLGPRMSWLAFLPILLAVVFMVLLPKGGVKAAGVPLTWGCGLLGLVSGWAALGALLKHRLPLMRNWFPVLLMILPLQAILIGSFALMGFDSKGTVLAVVTAVFVYPYLFFLFLGDFFDNSPNFDFMFKVLRRCIFGAAIYGLFLFAIFTVTGKLIEIRYVTTNGSEEKSVEKKNNTRGDMKKLISSYNNGNIYGICTLMFLPLFTVLEKTAWKRLLVKGAVVLTLSRTVWVGLVFSEVLCAFLAGRVDVRKLFRLTLMLLLAMAGIVVLLSLMGKGMDWLADENLGGRTRQFGILDHMSFFADDSFYEISEVVYMAFLREFGIAGFLGFLLFISVPVVGYFFQKTPGLIKKACMFGGVNYIVLCTSDGAFMLIPTLAFFWFLCAVIWCRNPYLRAKPENEINDRIPVN